MIDTILERDHRLLVLDRSFWRLIGRSEIHTRNGETRRASLCIAAAHRVHQWERELRARPVVAPRKGVR